MSDSATKDPFTPELAAALENATATPTAPTAPTAAVDGGDESASGSPLERAIVDAIKTVFDPEIPVNVYEIGLIYNIDVQPDGKVAVKMTLTSPACPSAQELPAEVKDRVEGVAGVTACDDEIVWDPTWNPSMMSEAARLQLGFF
jgi:FeS assembly SUF system protein